MAERMTRGGSTAWWDNQNDGAFTDDTAYECDAGLGTPSEVDCTQIEWHQMKPASDSLKVQAGEVLFYHSSKSFIPVASASASTVRTGESIKIDIQPNPAFSLGPLGSSTIFPRLHPSHKQTNLSPTHHTDTCYLAISATVSLVLNWAQIRTALSTLLSVCVQPPIQFPQGGRAYYAPQPRRVSGRGHRKGTRGTALNGI